MRSLHTLFLTFVAFLAISCAGTGAATTSTGGSNGDSAASGQTGSEAPSRSGNITVDRATAALGVEQREPVGVGESFVIADERVYVWTEILNGSGSSVRHVYHHHGEQTNEVILSVRSDRWRTWSYKTLLPGREGAWRVDIMTMDGAVLESVNFTVTSE